MAQRLFSQSKGQWACPGVLHLRLPREIQCDWEIQILLEEDIKTRSCNPQWGPTGIFGVKLIWEGWFCCLFFSTKHPPHPDFLIQNFQSAHLSRAWSVQFVRDEFNAPNPFAEFFSGMSEKQNCCS